MGKAKLFFCLHAWLLLQRDGNGEDCYIAIAKRMQVATWKPTPHSPCRTPWVLLRQSVKRGEEGKKGRLREVLSRAYLWCSEALLSCHFPTVPPIENTNSFRAKKSRGVLRAPRLGVGRLLQPKQ